MPGAASRGEQVRGRCRLCKNATTDEIASHDYILTPGRYVGAEEAEEDGEPFEQKMERLAATLEEQFAESAQLEAAIRRNLQGFWSIVAP